MRVRGLPMIGLSFCWFLCGRLNGAPLHKTTTPAHTSALKPILTTHRSTENQRTLSAPSLIYVSYRIWTESYEGSHLRGKAGFVLFGGRKTISKYRSCQFVWENTVLLGELVKYCSRVLHTRDQKFLKLLGTCIFQNVLTASVYHEVRCEIWQQQSWQGFI